MDTNLVANRVDQQGGNGITVIEMRHVEKQTEILMTASLRRIIVKSARVSLDGGNGKEIIGWYELEVSAAPNTDQNIAPFRVAGDCEVFLADMVRLRDWLLRYGVAEAEEVYKLITHSI